MKNPRGKYPSLIGSSNGKPERIIAERKSKCHRCKTEIPKGLKCIGIPKIGAGFNSTKRYCLDCFKKIIEQTQKDFDKAKALINIEETD